MKHLILIALAVLAVGCSGGSKGDASVASSPADNTSPNQSTATGSNDVAAKQSGGLNPNDSATESEFPIPFYPGSTEDSRAPIPTMGHDLPGGERSLSSNRMTTDSVQKVFDFYKPKVTNVLSQNVTSEQASITGTASGNNVVVTVKKEDQGTSVTIGVELLKKK